MSTTITLKRRTWMMGTAAALTAPALPTLAATTAPASIRALPVCHQVNDPNAPPPASPFTALEVAIVTALVDALLPADQSPSAVSLGTATHVVNGLSQGGPDAVSGAQQGLAAVNGLALQAYGVPFPQLSPAKRDVVVGTVTQVAALTPLWLGVRALAVLHYYAQPPAYLDLGMPGPSINAGGFPRPNDVPCNT